MHAKLLQAIFEVFLLLYEDDIPLLTDLNVLCLRVLNWIVGNLDGALIVAVEWHILQVDTVVLESLLHPEKLSTARSSGNVFKFSSGERYTILLL